MATHRDVDGDQSQPRSGMRLEDMFRRCLHNWQMIISFAAALTILAGIYVAITPHVYASTAYITAPAGSTTEGFAMSALKAFAGSSNSVTSASDPQTRYQLFLQVIMSEDVAHDMLDKDGFKYTIFSDRWNAAAGSWHPSHAPFNVFKRFLLGLLGFSDPVAPTATYMQSFIKGGLKVTTDLSTGFTTMEFKYKDPAFALRFLTALMKAADHTIRLSDIRALTAVLDDLNQQLGTITNQPQSDALIAQITAMKIQLSQAVAGPEYSYDLIQGPAIEDQAIWPRPLLTLAVAFALGIVMAAAFVIYAPPHILARFSPANFWSGRRRYLPSSFRKSPDATGDFR